MTDQGWNKIKREFERLVAREGVANIAPLIPARRETVYRILRGETKNPSMAVKKGIKDLVEKKENGSDQQS